MILITRPQEEAEIFAKELQSLGFKTLCAPMLTIHPIAFDAPDLTKFQALIFTSSRAVRLFTPHIQTLKVPAYCVGKQTAHAAQDSGVQTIYCAEGTGEKLTTLILNQTPKDNHKPLLHVRGFDTAIAIDKILKPHGINIETLIIYKAELTDHLSSECTQALQNGTITAATFFSARTAKNFISLARKNAHLGILKTTKALCISQSVLGCVQPATWQNAYSAKTPDRAGMIELIKRIN